jgi:WD and tetratricopeptide repeat-containing protein 1
MYGLDLVSFGGARSDKVCSGSDDGNWFMWDKTTGRLEGIWEGDESVVNGKFALMIKPCVDIPDSDSYSTPLVVEQHPSLPIFAVSGIDSTVKVRSRDTLLNLLVNSNN